MATSNNLSKLQSQEERKKQALFNNNLIKDCITSIL